MIYAIIEHGIVVNRAVADAPLADNWIQSDDAHIGDLYQDGVFKTPPQPTSVTSTNTRMLPYFFMARMTQAERVAIRTAAAQSAIIADFVAMLNVAPYVELSDDGVITDINSLVPAGLLTADRPAVILDTTIPDYQLYKG